MSSDLEKLINGISDTVRVLQLVINSKDRVDYNTTSSTDFRVNLLNPINASILAYGLESCCIPKTSYNISASNNSFEIEDSVGIKTVTIPVGNYSSTALQTELQTQLNALTPDTYVVTITNNHFSIVSSSPDFILNPNDTYFNLLMNLGYNPDIAYNASLTDPPNYFVDAPYIFDLSGSKNLYIKIEQLSEYMRDTRNLSCNFKVDYGCPFGSIVYFGKAANYKQDFTTVQNHLIRPSYFDVKLVDENNEVVDLNGSNWSMVLRFITKDLY